MSLPVGIGHQRQPAVVPGHLPQDGEHEQEHLREESRTSVSSILFLVSPIAPEAKAVERGANSTEDMDLFPKGGPGCVKEKRGEEGRKKERRKERRVKKGKKKERGKKRKV